MFNKQVLNFIQKNYKEFEKEMKQIKLENEKFDKESAELRAQNLKFSQSIHSDIERVKNHLK